MVYRPNVNMHLVSVLMPFKPPFDSYYEEIIKPAAKAAGLETVKADEIYPKSPGDAIVGRFALIARSPRPGLISPSVRNLHIVIGRLVGGHLPRLQRNT